MIDGMEETAGQVLGRLVRSRRERLALRQDELVEYGGPGVATVSKIERATQEHWAVRTRHQMEKALGWPRGTIGYILKAPAEPWWVDDALRLDFEQSLIEDDLPDLSGTVQHQPDNGGSPIAAVSDDELLTEITYRVRSLKARLAELEGNHASEKNAPHHPDEPNGG